MKSTQLFLLRILEAETKTETKCLTEKCARKAISYLVLRQNLYE